MMSQKVELIFLNMKYICKMHKARVRANNYYFAELFHKKGIRRENFIWKKDLLFLLNDKYESGCSYYNNQSKKNKVMEKETILEGLKYAEKNFYIQYLYMVKKIQDTY